MGEYQETTEDKLERINDTLQTISETMITFLEAFMVINGFSALEIVNKEIKTNDKT